VAVLADPDKCDVDLNTGDQRVEPAALGGQVAFAVDEVERLHRQRQVADEPLPQVEAKRRGVRDRQARVFIEVEAGHVVPRDVALGHQGHQHFQLRRAGGDDDIRVPVLRQRRADLIGAVLGGLRTHLVLRRRHVDLHVCLLAHGSIISGRTWRRKRRAHVKRRAPSCSG
jgi:hypothetical protein